MAESAESGMVGVAGMHFSNKPEQNLPQPSQALALSEDDPTLIRGEGSFLHTIKQWIL
jgi:hypothetical protein